MEIHSSQTPSLAFAATNVGGTSSDSPQSVTIENIGNATLGSTALTIGANFLQVDGSGTPPDCTADSSLAPGGTCNLSFSFEPTAAGALASAAVLTDNSLNGKSPTQSIALNGTGVLNTTSTALVSSADPSLFGQPVTFTATVTAASGAVPTGSVNFMHSTTLLGSGTLVGGVATFTTSTLDVATLSITAVYTGSAADAPSTSPVLKQSVLIGTSTALASMPNPSLLGQAVTFTATVTATTGATPTGTVSFMHGSTLLGKGTLTNGVATFSTSALDAATLSITAVYAGHSSDVGSMSPVVKQVVLYPTTTTLTSAPNPSVVGEAVTFTATVAASAGPVPSGTVDFYHSTTLLGSGTLAGGVATFTTSTLPQTTLSIHAVYLGHSEDAGSSSNVVKQVVDK